MDCVELARRWCLPESWVREHVLQGVSDPIPICDSADTSAFDVGVRNSIRGWSDELYPGIHRAEGEPERGVPRKREPVANKRARQPIRALIEAPLQNDRIVIHEPTARILKQN